MLQKKVCQGGEQKKHSLSVAEKLSVKPSLEGNDIQTAEVLMLAHEVAMQRSLQERQETHRRLMGLDNQLRDAGITLETRLSKAETLLIQPEQNRSTVSNGLKTQQKDIDTAMDRGVNSGWLEIITSGDAAPTQSDVFETNFSHLWDAHVIHDETPVYLTRPQSMLEDLQSRVAIQHARLERWRMFQLALSRRSEDCMLKSPARASPTKSPTKSPRKLVSTNGAVATPRRALTSPHKKTPAGLHIATPPPLHNNGMPSRILATPKSRVHNQIALSE